MKERGPSNERECIQSPQVGIQRLFADILVPQLGMVSDKRLHETPALRVVDDNQFDAARLRVVLGSAKCAILTNDYFAYAVEEDRTAAHVARR